jgi:DHA3 family macrolide efflux protein-like MFS transporter
MAALRSAFWPIYRVNDKILDVIDAPGRLFNRSFLMLLQARFVSVLGQEATRIAMLYLVMKVTGSATQMGIVAMLGAIPSVLAAPIGGFLADRYSRKWIMIANDVTRGLLLLALPVMLWANIPASLVMGFIYFMAFMLAASGAIFMPSVSAILPQIVPAPDLNRANSLTQGSSALTSLLGQGMGGVLYRVLGPATLFFANAVTYLASALCIAFIREPPRPRKEIAGDSMLAAFVADTGEGVAYCWRQKGLRKILLSALVINFFAAPTTVLLPLLVDRTYALPPDWFGYFVAVTVLGNIFGMAVTGIFPFDGTRRWIAAFSGFALAGFGFLGIGFAPPVYVTVGLFFLVGAGTSILSVLIVSKLQASVPTDLLGRVMAAVNVLSSATVPVAMLIGGIVTDALDRNVLPVFIASGIACIGFVAWLVADRDIRAYMSSRSS